MTENTGLSIDKIEYNKKELQELADKYSWIEIKDIHDKENIEKIKEWRKTLVKKRREIENIWKELRDDANKFRNQVLDREKEFKGILEDVEKELKEKEEKVKEMELKEERKHYIPYRQEMLHEFKEKIAVDDSYETLIEMDNEEFWKYKEQKEKEYNEKIQEEKRIEEERRKAQEEERRKEEKRKQEEERKRLEELDEERKNQTRKLLDGYHNSIPINIPSRDNKDYKDMTEEEFRNYYNKLKEELDNEKQKQEEREKKKEEERMRKNKEYQNFLKENWVKENDENIEIRRVWENKFEMWQKIDEKTIE